MNSAQLINRLHRIELKQKSRKIDGGPLLVYYGWAKISKVRKKEAISVIFENQSGAGTHNRYGKTLKKFQHTVYVRQQTENEVKDAKASIRVFTEYSIFLDDKKINGSLNAALSANSEADKNNVTKEIRDEIEQCLRKFYMEQHPGFKEREIQLEIKFE